MLLVDESFTVTDMLRNGWLPADIIALKWYAEEGKYHYKFSFAGIAKVMKDRNYVAIVEQLSPRYDDTIVKLLDARGNVVREICGPIDFMGRKVSGYFSRFADSSELGILSVLFEVDRPRFDYRVDFDIATGAQIRVAEIR